MNRNELQDSYVQDMIDGMDLETMEQFVRDSLNQNLDKYTDEELKAEIEDYYPELLD